MRNPTCALVLDPFDGSAHALDLAALDRQQGIAAAFVALDELHFHAKQSADKFWRLADATSGARAAD